MNAINFGGVAPPAGNSSEVPSLFECLMDRDQTEMPEYYLPEAQGVVIAGEAMLRAAGYRPGSYRPRLFGKPVWYQEKRHVFRRLTYDEGRVLQVRGCGDFWVVERFYQGDTRPDGLGYAYNISALVCAFSGRPIWTRKCQAAMRLADYCDPTPQPPVAGFWKKAWD
jgi:hypothetical protein